MNLLGSLRRPRSDRPGVGGAGRGGEAGGDRGLRVQPAHHGGRGRGSAVEPGAHPALQPHRARLARRAGTWSSRTSSAWPRIRPSASSASSRWTSSIPAEGATQAGHAAERADGVAVVRLLARGAAAGPGLPGEGRGRPAGRVDRLPGPPLRRRAAVRRDAAPDAPDHVDAAAAGHLRPPPAGLHGRDVRLRAPHRRSHRRRSRSSRSSSRRGLMAWAWWCPRRTRWTWTTRSSPTPGPGCWAVCRRSGTRRASWKGSGPRAEPWTCVRWTRSSAGCGKREFVLRTTRSAEPSVFTTRWAMSYLRGGLTREEVGRLAGAAPNSGMAGAPGTTADAGGRRGRGRGRGGIGRRRRGGRGGGGWRPRPDETPVAPSVPSSVPVYYLDPAAPWAGDVGGVPGSSRLEPALVARLRLTFDDRRAQVDHTEEWEAVFFPLAAHFNAASGRDVDYDERDFRDGRPGTPGTC